VDILESAAFKTELLAVRRVVGVRRVFGVNK
jgi:hypothetical protein